MVSKEEFEEMWGKRCGDVKRVRLESGGVVLATDYYIIGFVLYLIINQELNCSFDLRNIKGIERDEKKQRKQIEKDVIIAKAEVAMEESGDR